VGQEGRGRRAGSLVEQRGANLFRPADPSWESDDYGLCEIWTLAATLGDSGRAPRAFGGRKGLPPVVVF